MCRHHQTEKKQCKKCDYCHTITKKDFYHCGISSETFIIRKSGKYCLVDNIHFEPKCSNVAIIIDADDVHLDLCKHELKQSNLVGRCIGIKILTGHSNVTIVNGAIRNFTQFGMYVEGDQENIFLGENDTKLFVTGCGYGSSQSFFEPNTNTPILQGGILLGETKNIEDRGYYTYNGTIQTAQLNNVFVEENGPIGFCFGICSNLTVQNSSFSYNTDNRQVGRDNPLNEGFVRSIWNAVYPILYMGNPKVDDFSSTVQFLNCHTDKNTTTLGGFPQICTSIIAWNINGIIIKNSTFDSNSGTNSTGGFGVAGITFGGCTGVVVEECTANANSNTGLPGSLLSARCEGFHHSGVNLGIPPPNITSALGPIYRKCSSIGNKSMATVFPACGGIDFYYCDGLTVDQCVSTHNQGIAMDPDNAFGYSDGMIITGDFDLEGGEATNILVKNCHITENTTNCINGDVEGIYIGAPVMSVLIDECTIQANNGIFFNSGIWVNGENKGICVKNCVIQEQTLSIYDDGSAKSIYQGNIINNSLYGVFLDGASCSSVKNNNIENVDTGIQDTTNPSNNLVSGNKVFGATIPYDVTYAFGPVPVVNGSLVTGFPTGAEVCDNIFIDNPACSFQAQLSPQNLSVSKLKYEKKLEPLI